MPVAVRVASLVVSLSVVALAVASSALVRRRHDSAVEPVDFIVGTRGEEQRIGRLRPKVVAESDAPQPVDHQHLTIAGSQLARESIVLGVERVDRAVTEVAYEKIAAELAEVGGRDRHSPWSVELAACRHAFDQKAIGIEDIDDS